jgi:glycosyltransferase involved in cell wall biosynthesis
LYVACQGCCVGEWGSPASIMIQAFNYFIFIRAAINSVLEQAYQDWDLVIFDDDFVDNSIIIAHEYEISDPRISGTKNINEKAAPRLLVIRALT